MWQSCLAVHHRISNVEILRQTRHRFIDRRIPVGVESPIVSPLILADFRYLPLDASFSLLIAYKIRR